VQKILSPKHIIKNIAMSNAVGLQQIVKLWKSIMKKKQLKMDQKDPAKNARLS
jgi:hypothetical protein